MAVQEIPLTAAPQRFSIQINGVTYNMTVLWRDTPQGGWVLDVADVDFNPVLQGVPLVTGTDLLAQFEYLGLGGQMIVQTDHDVDAVPNYDNLGSSSHLYFVTA